MLNFLENILWSMKEYEATIEKVKNFKNDNNISTYDKCCYRMTSLLLLFFF